MPSVTGDPQGTSDVNQTGDEPHRADAHYDHYDQETLALVFPICDPRCVGNTHMMMEPRHEKTRVECAGAGFDRWFGSL